MNNNNSGHIYVLINYSMENLIKIGKTSREPEERAKELSSVTGVPTPFIVAYDAFFYDCSEAENYIHNKLEQLGYRLSSNREFFQAPLKKVISIIFEAQQVLNSHAPFEEPLSTQTDDKVLDEEKISWSDLEELASYYLNSGNEAEAYKLFNQALTLGSKTAYYWLGLMTLYGWGCLEDEQEAKDYLTKGAANGDVRCYGELGNLYDLYKWRWNDVTTSKIWFEKYLEHKDFLEPHFRRASYVINFLSSDRQRLEDILLKYKNVLSSIKDELINYIIKRKEDFDDDEEFKQLLLKIGKAIKNTL